MVSSHQRAVVQRTNVQDFLATPVRPKVRNRKLLIPIPRRGIAEEDPQRCVKSSVALTGSQ